MNYQQGLAGFLQKKTLFNNTPKNIKGRSRSKSKDGRDSIIRKVNQKQLDQKYINPNQNSFQKNYAQNNNLSFQNLYQRQEPLFTNTQSRVVPAEQINNKNIDNKFMQNQTYQNNYFNNNKNDKNNDNIFKVVAGYGASFQSARVQSAQCLQNLSFRLNAQISSINYRIDEFKNSIGRVLVKQLREVKQKIIKMVQVIYSQSQRSIQQYIRYQQSRLANDIIKVRQNLQKQYVKIETMKQQINRPQWRKVAGQILSTQLQKRIDQNLKQAKQVDLKRWNMRDLSGQRFKTLEEQLRNIFRLKE